MQRGLALALAIALIAARASDAELPHVLWITAEDMGPHLGCYGDDYAVTPALDALAAKGMRYTNANSNAPVCAPARTAIITGIYPNSIGAEHMRSEVRLPSAFRLFPQLLRDAGYYCTNNSKEDYNVVKEGRVWDDSSRRAHWNARREGQPFFAVFNHTMTHESQIRNAIRPRHQIHDPAKARIPPYHPDTAEVRRDWAQYYDHITMMDAAVGANLRELEQAALAENTVIFFFSDHGSGMPRHKRWPYNSGLHVPLIVYVPVKWRHLAPKDYEPGGTSDRLVSFVDLAPTMLSLAGTRPPDWMQGSAFAGEYQAAEPPFSYGLCGRMDERYDMVRSVRDKRYIYIRNFMPHRVYGQHVSYMFATPTTRAWQQLFKAGDLNKVQARFWQTKPPEELYDLHRDPDEITNLVDSPEHTDVLSRMRRANKEWAAKIKDVGFLPESEMHARAGDGTIYDMGHDARRYDFEAVFAAADLSTTLSAGDVARIAKLLEHKDSAVRYWGAVGLLAQREVGVQAGREALVRALGDESAMVRIAAAEGLGRFSGEQETEAALEVLLEQARQGNDYFLSLAAWNALDHLDERARPALASIKAASVEGKPPSSRMGSYTALVKRQTLADFE